MSQKRIFAVSDIHGNGHLLLRLLMHARYHPNQDRLILLGDYVNKGPDSVGTLRLVQGLVRNGAIALLGNNERSWLDSGDPEAAPWRNFIEALPLWTEEEDYVFVHAGFRPGIPMHEQRVEDLTGIRKDFLQHFAIPGKTIVFGHTPTFRLGSPEGCVWAAPGKMGIDTGAGHGLCLALVNLTEREAYTIGIAEGAPIITRSIRTV